MDRTGPAGGGHDELLAEARQCHRDEHYGRAAQCYAEILDRMDTPHPDAAQALEQAAVVAEMAATQGALGHWAASEPALTAAIDAVQHGPAAAAAGATLVLAQLRSALARCLTVRRALPEALTEALAAATLFQGQGAEMQRGLAIGQAGAIHFNCGEPETGLAMMAESLQILDRPTHRAHDRERVALIANLAAVNTMLGRFDLAAGYFTRAIATMQGLVNAGRNSVLADLGRSHMNLGTALEVSGRLDEAERSQRAAIADYGLALRKSPRDADTTRIQVSRAIALMNLGYTLFRMARPVEAQRCYERSGRALARLVPGRDDLLPDQAKTWVNQGHLALQAGRARAAASLYGKGLAVFDRMLAQSHARLVSEQANAALGLARAEVALGQVEASCGRFSQALQTLVGLTRQGHLRHAAAWLVGWQAQMAAVLAARATRQGPAREAAMSTLLQTLQTPPQRGLVGGDDAPQALLQGVALADSWLHTGPAQADEALQPVVSSFLRHLMGWLAEVLAESEPAWLQRHAGTLQEAIDRLRTVAERLPAASMWLADWFLHTRGLRAQRTALAQGADVRLEPLRDALTRLRQLEDQMLGAVAARQALPLLGASVPSPEAESQAVAWRAMSTQVMALRDEAVNAGLLPAALRLSAQVLLAQMPAHSALLLLAHCNTQRLLVLVLQGGARAGVHHRWVALRSEVEPFGLAGLNGLARLALAQSAVGRQRRSAATPARTDGGDMPPADVSDGDLFALEAYRGLWDDAAAPELAALAASAVEEVALVPSDELHLVPWSHFAAEAGPLPTRLALYPSTGAWLRCARSVAPDDRLAAPRWAVASWAALDSARPLPWVEVEQRLSRRLWGAVSAPISTLQCPHPQLDGVDALMGMGHGAAPGDNPARSGLALGGGEVLAAHDLQGVRHCRRVLMSACVLGRTDEVFGEALGFLSGAFALDTVFGSGWLTEVPDADACLFSLALQHALRQAVGTPLGWGDVFRQVRQAIAQGEWPPGFGAWLESALPAALAAENEQVRKHIREHLHDQIAAKVSPEVFTRPPMSLQRLLPWAVALGR